MKELHLTIKVTPNAAKTAIVGLMENGVIKMKIKGAPEKGKANQELCRFLQDVFQVAKNDVILISGVASRLKQVKVVGKDEEDLKKILPSL